MMMMVMMMMMMMMINVRTVYIHSVLVRICLCVYVGIRVVALGLESCPSLLVSLSPPSLRVMSVLGTHFEFKTIICLHPSYHHFILSYMSFSSINIAVTSSRSAYVATNHFKVISMIQLM